jgi:chorismate synthase
VGALRRKGILIGTHVARCAGIEDAPFTDPAHQIEQLNKSAFAVLDAAKGEAMRAAIEKAAEDGDSVGGVLETAVTGMPAGVGEPWFDTLEGLLAHGLFAIPAVKGVEFGDGFALAEKRGSEANDAFALRQGKTVTRTNHNGGINGGISNGMPLLFRCAVKPTPSIALPQDSVNAEGTAEETLQLGGRHDPAVVHRARVVADSVTALVLCDALALRFGTDWLGGNPV